MTFYFYYLFNFIILFFLCCSPDALPSESFRLYTPNHLSTEMSGRNLGQIEPPWSSQIGRAATLPLSPHGRLSSSVNLLGYAQSLWGGKSFWSLYSQPHSFSRYRYTCKLRALPSTSAFFSPKQTCMAASVCLSICTDLFHVCHTAVNGGRNMCYTRSTNHPQSFLQPSPI